MKKIIFALTVMAAAVAAQADVVTFSANKAFTSTNWTDSLSLSQFDASLGTLTGVRFNYSGTVSTIFSVESLDTAATVISLDSAGRLVFSGPFSATLNATNAVTRNLSAFDGVLDFGGTSGATVGPVLGSDIGLFNVGGFLGSYIGGGTFNVGIDGTGLSTVRGGGNLISQNNTQAAADIRVTYTYTPTTNTVPEPGSLYLMGLALAGLGVATRRRKAV